MKLSEAIREGAKLYPQCFHEYFQPANEDGVPGDPTGPITGCCALGGAALVLDVGPDTLGAKVAVKCPEQCDADLGSTGRAIVHLNDEHRWTREAIADWVETIETSASDVQERDADTQQVS